MNKKLYEVINPSDEITFYAPSDKVAVAAVLVCGEGQWGATRIEDDGDVDVGGMLLFSDEEQTNKYLQKWLRTSDLGYVLDHYGEEIATALESMAIMSSSERYAYDEAVNAIRDPVARKKYIKKVNNHNRTSLNDITSYAHKMAEKVREKIKKGK